MFLFICTLDTCTRTHVFLQTFYSKFAEFEAVKIIDREEICESDEADIVAQAFHNAIKALLPTTKEVDGELEEVTPEGSDVLQFVFLKGFPLTSDHVRSLKAAGVLLHCIVQINSTVTLDAPAEEKADDKRGKPGAKGAKGGKPEPKTAPTKGQEKPAPKKDGKKDDPKAKGKDGKGKKGEDEQDALPQSSLTEQVGSAAALSTHQCIADYLRDVMLIVREMKVTEEGALDETEDDVVSDVAQKLTHFYGLRQLYDQWWSLQVYNPVSTLAEVEWKSQLLKRIKSKQEEVAVVMQASALETAPPKTPASKDGKSRPGSGGAASQSAPAKKKDKKELEREKEQEREREILDGLNAQLAAMEKELAEMPPLEPYTIQADTSHSSSLLASIPEDDIDAQVVLYAMLEQLEKSCDVSDASHTVDDTKRMRQGSAIESVIVHFNHHTVMEYEGEKVADYIDERLNELQGKTSTLASKPDPSINGHTPAELSKQMFAKQRILPSFRDEMAPADSPAASHQGEDKEKTEVVPPVFTKEEDELVSFSMSIHEVMSQVHIDRELLLLEFEALYAERMKAQEKPWSIVALGEAQAGEREETEFEDYVFQENIDSFTLLRRLARCVLFENAHICSKWLNKIDGMGIVVMYQEVPSCRMKWRSVEADYTGPLYYPSWLNLYTELLNETENPTPIDNSVEGRRKEFRLAHLHKRLLNTTDVIHHHHIENGMSLSEELCTLYPCDGGIVTVSMLHATSRSFRCTVWKDYVTFGIRSTVLVEGSGKRERQLEYRAEHRTQCPDPRKFRDSPVYFNATFEDDCCLNVMCQCSLEFQRASHDSPNHAALEEDQAVDFRTILQYSVNNGLVVMQDTSGLITQTYFPLVMPNTAKLRHAQCRSEVVPHWDAHTKSVVPGVFQEVKRTVDTSGVVSRFLTRGTIQLLFPNGDVSVFYDGWWLVTGVGGRRTVRHNQSDEVVGIAGISTAEYTDTETCSKVFTRTDFVMTVHYCDGTVLAQHSDGTRIWSGAAGTQRRVEAQRFGSIEIVIDEAGQCVTQMEVFDNTILRYIHGREFGVLRREEHYIRVNINEFTVAFEPQSLTTDHTKGSDGVLQGIYFFDYLRGSFRMRDYENNSFFADRHANTSVKLFDPLESNHPYSTEEDGNESQIKRIDAELELLWGIPSGSLALLDARRAPPSSQIPQNEVQQHVASKEAKQNALNKFAPPILPRKRSAESVTVLKESLGRLEVHSSSIKANDTDTTYLNHAPYCSFNSHRPKLFTINPDGSGSQFHTSLDMLNYIKWATRNQDTSIHQDTVSGQNNVSFITFTTKYFSYERLFLQRQQLLDKMIPKSVASVHADQRLPVKEETKLIRIPQTDHYPHPQQKELTWRQFIKFDQVSVKCRRALKFAVSRNIDINLHKQRFAKCLQVHDQRQPEERDTAAQVKVELDAKLKQVEEELENHEEAKRSPKQSPAPSPPPAHAPTTGAPSTIVASITPPLVRGDSPTHEMHESDGRGQNNLRTEDGQHDDAYTYGDIEIGTGTTPPVVPWHPEGTLSTQQGSSSNPKNEAREKPKKFTSSVTVVNFGTVQMGGTYDTEFMLHNYAGKATRFHLKHGKPSQSKMFVISCRTGPIAPGLSAKVTVQFKAQSIGTFQDEIFIESEHSHPIRLPIQATVI